MEEFYIFDIPIYIKSEERYERDMSNRIERELAPYTNSSTEQKANAEANSRLSHGGQWQFSQIIGWLRLYAESSHTGAHEYGIQSEKTMFGMPQRLTHNTKKRFYLVSPNDLLGLCCIKESSEEIFQSVEISLNEISKGQSLKKRYMDLGSFERIGPFINWRALLDFRISS